MAYLRQLKLRKNYFGLTAAVILMGAASAHVNAGGLIETEFDAANFPASSNNITNQYWPLSVVGPTLVYRAETEDECLVNGISNTGGVKVILGINTLIVKDQEWRDNDCDGGKDVLLEDTFDWYAQDNDGNVWYLGEETLDYEEDPPSSEGSWEAGQDVAGIGSIAEAGIIMLANPSAGDFYFQEFYEDEAEDQGKVLKLNASVSLEMENAIDDEYENCLKTKEWTGLSPGTIEHKYYCKDVGLVWIEELSGGKTVDVELVEIK